jgi:hypothetical protein
MKRIVCSKQWKVACIAGLMIAGGATARADENDQVWLTATVKAGLTSNLTLKVASQQRWRDADHTYRHMDYGADYKINSSWSVAATFRDQMVKNKKGVWQSCSGYLFDGVHSMKGYGIELKSRMRLTYFDPHYSADCTTEFRPRFDLMPAQGLTSWKLKPYVADEIMYNLEEGHLYRNRVSVGLKCSPLKALMIDLSLMNERTETNGEWAENWNPCLAATWSF